MLLCGLNEGNHVYDYVFKKIIRMYKSIKCKNIKMIYLSLLAKNKRKDTSRHEQTITMIIEPNHGISGFDNDEIKDILYYISTI